MLRGSSIIPHTVEICGVCARSLAIYIYPVNGGMDQNDQRRIFEKL